MFRDLDEKFSSADAEEPTSEADLRNFFDRPAVGTAILAIVRNVRMDGGDTSAVIFKNGVNECLEIGSFI